MSSMFVMTTHDTSIPIVSVGSFVTPHLSFSNVCHILNLMLNLVSVSQLCNFDYLILFLLLLCVGFTILEIDWNRP